MSATASTASNTYAASRAKPMFKTISARGCALERGKSTTRRGRVRAAPDRWRQGKIRGFARASISPSVPTATPFGCSIFSAYCTCRTHSKSAELRPKKARRPVQTRRQPFRCAAFQSIPTQNRFHANQLRLSIPFRPAEIRAGELLAETEKNKGAAGGGKKDAPRGRIKLPRDTTPKLAELGITKTQSSRWQKLAGLPRAEQEAKRAEP